MENQEPESDAVFRARLRMAASEIASQDERTKIEIAIGERLNALGEKYGLRRNMGHLHPNGAPMFATDGTMLDDLGNRSIFDDVDEPLHLPLHLPNEPGWRSQNLSLRDWFAGLAMQGMWAAEAAKPVAERSRLVIAKNAYEMADAMLAARSKP